MVEIIFESHGTTYDNEAHKASGHFDVDLSALGIQQAEEMGERYRNADFAAIFCSDLKRSYETAALAFHDRFPIFKDARLRECNYGDMTRAPSEQIEAERSKHIDTPFPSGESYRETTERVQKSLQDILKKYDGKRIMIIGHRATQFGLEHFINGVPLEQLTLAPWHWRPGWSYELIKLPKV